MIDRIAAAVAGSLPDGGVTARAPQLLYLIVVLGTWLLSLRFFQLGSFAWGTTLTICSTVFCCAPLIAEKYLTTKTKEEVCSDE